MKSLFIIDSMSIIFKAYYAMIRNPLYSPNGFPTSAIYGFFNQLFKILDVYNPEYLVLTYDSKEKTFRHEEYEAYKSSRIKIPEDLIPQIEKIKEIVNLLNIPSIIKPGYEADDIIGTLSKIFTEQKINCYILSPDKDLLQLINEHTFLVRTIKSFDDFILYDTNKFIQDYGFEPKYMIDFLALVGDSSDDIPGVKGLGEKSVIPLIKEFNTIENIYNNIDKVPPKIQTKLLEGKDNAFLSKKLATINKDIPLDNNIENYQLKKIDTTEVIKIFNELNIKSLQQKVIHHFSSNLNTTKTHQQQETKIEIAEINTKKELNEFIKKLPYVISIVINNKIENNLITSISSIEISFGQNIVYKIVLDTETDLFGNISNPNSITNEDLNKFFQNINSNTSLLITENSKSLFHTLNFLKIEPKMKIFDLTIAHYLLDPEASHKIEDIIKENITSINPNLSNQYNIVYFQQLLPILKQKLDDKNLTNLLNDIELPLSKTLTKIEFNGIKIDTKTLHELGITLKEKLQETEKTIYQLAGEEFNINSPKQLSTILYEKLSLKPVSKTKTGLSTDAQTLDELKSEHLIIEHIINYRTYTKLLNTYIEALPKYIHPDTGKIHAQINQILASTGRLTISNPNLQNIPIRTELGKEIRKAFVSYDDNSLLLSSDYSQIELRILAHFTQDKTLKYAFENNLDIHSQTAAELFNINIKDVDTNMRRTAKTINFGIIYGLGPFGLKTRLGISSTEAKEIIQNYFKKFSGIYDYIEDTKKFAKQNGYTETLLGRKRYFKNINSQNKVVASYEERAAINHPIQGTAADIIKKAMIDIDNYITHNRLQSKMILQIHDELLFNIIKTELDFIKSAIKQIMENTIQLDVPLNVEMGIAKNWLEAH